MKVVIGSIDVLAWKAVLVQWEAHVDVSEEGVRTPKPEESWSEEELKKAKYNSRALSAFHCSVSRKTFELIQGCETTKEASDLLQTHFEGTTKVQNSRRDMIASRFENLRMEEHESIADFSSKLKSLAQEASTLGKKYKDQKLVKEFLRCLPSKFMAYKSTLHVSQNTEELNFGEVVGMLQAHEMELDGADSEFKRSKNMALMSSAANELGSSNEDPMSLLVRKFDRALRRVERGQTERRFEPAKRPEADRNFRKSEIQCYECKGYGHVRTECPTVKGRNMTCVGCKGMGHTHLECVDDRKRRRERFILAEADSKETSKDEEELNNLVATIGIIKEGDSSDSETDEEHDDDLAETYMEVHEMLIRLGQENSTLIKEKQRLEAVSEALKIKLVAEKKLGHESVVLMKEKLVLATKVDILEKELHSERETSSQLQSQLDLHHKKIHMFTGTKQLDKILSYGRTEKSYSGLGYTGRDRLETEGIKFVSARESQPAKYIPNKKNMKKKGCYFCVKLGHIKAACYKFLGKVKELRYQGKFTWNGFQNQIWVKKTDLKQTATRSASTSTSGLKFCCNMAILSEEQEDTGPWYFDSGCSRHMTGTMSNLQTFDTTNEGKVTFGDGSHGAVQGKGKTCESGLPQLMNVYLVQGLKANLISVSQLCDEGLTVSFTSIDCKDVDKYGTTTLRGVRSGDNCYRWKDSAKCFREEDDLYSRHQWLGNMNTKSHVTGVNQDMLHGVSQFKGGDQPEVNKVHEDSASDEQPESDEYFAIRRQSISDQTTGSRVPRDHSATYNIGGVNEGRKIRGIKKGCQDQEHLVFVCLVCVLEPENHVETLEDEPWIRTNGWELVLRSI
ncbi:hypothetical protein AALP_AA3G258400 [Arabis alpina]|nr:hypothetical protein AALP_AA3G258400 [Arabis alpina]